ncbi:MAG TPA: PLP-dependent aspartate aminotransferase family protein [Saprospiraceae bacterium]|nr:PLP-dependent aspartate aminotransferase family protein [Saprospiraceae bacterium]
MPPYHPDTQAIHAGYRSDDFYGAVAMPIILTTTFERGPDGKFVEGRDIYARSSNPNRRMLEDKLTLLEGGQGAAAFSSGQAATMSIFHALGAGSHILIPDDIYYGTRVLLEKLYGPWGASFTAVDMTDIDRVKAAIQDNTRLIWIESPSNPSLKVTDIEAVASLAREKNILTGCDNTWASSFFCRPLSVGVDVVMHSSTKYFGGHSDLTGGCVIWGSNAALSQKIRDFQTLGGAVPSAFDSWLLFRSLSTYPLRMKKHGENALQLAEFLESHPAIEKVHYPGLPSDRFHTLASKQMHGGYGGMVSILVKGGAEEALHLASRLQLVCHATSLGGVESLVDHRQTAEGVHSLSPPNLLRISVGLEHISDLIADFKQALG